MIVSSTQTESDRQPLERQGATPRPNATPPARRKPLRLAVPTLLALLAALAAAPAAAQTVTTLVSNIGQGNDAFGETSSTRKVAQGFTTGSNATGYTLSSIDIVSENSNAFTAAVYTVNASGQPDTLVASLTSPGSFAAGTLTFTAPASTTLAASTEYSVVMQGVTFTVSLDATTSDAEDSGAAAGWSIANAFHLTTSATGPWSENNAGRSIRIAVKGYANTAAAATLISNSGQTQATLSLPATCRPAAAASPPGVQRRPATRSPASTSSSVIPRDDDVHRQHLHGQRQRPSLTRRSRLLTAPTGFAAGTLVFTAPASTDTRREYDLRRASPEPRRATTCQFRSAASADAEDSGAAAGWSIADAYDLKNTGGVQTAFAPLKGSSQLRHRQHRPRSSRGQPRPARPPPRARTSAPTRSHRDGSDRPAALHEAKVITGRRRPGRGPRRARRQRRLHRAAPRAWM